MFCQERAMVDQDRLFDWHSIVPRTSSSSRSSQTIGVPSIRSNASSVDSSAIPRTMTNSCTSSNPSTSQTNITTYPANEEEFSKLPPAIRRKQFSTVERLRLAQQSATNTTQHEPKPRSLSAASNHSKDSAPRSPHTPISPLFPKSPMLTRSPSRSPRKESPEKRVKTKHSEPVIQKDLILTQSDARWFLQLGDTIKRKLFTADERLLLQSKCEDMIQNFERNNTNNNEICNAPTNDNMPFSSADFNDSLTTLATVSTSKVDAMDLAPRPKASYEPTTITTITASTEASIPTKTTTRRAIIRESFKWIEDDEHELETQLVLDSLDEGNIHTTTVEVPDTYSSRRNSRRPSIKRTLSLTRNSDRNSISKPSDASEWSSNLRARRMSRRSTMSQSLSIPSKRVSYSAASTPTRASMDQDAAFWQDPDARLKLRIYLASAQNFDEALEFGFPQLQDGTKEFANTRPKSQVLEQPEALKSSMSFLADSDDEDDKDSMRSLKRGRSTKYQTRERLHIKRNETSLTKLAAAAPSLKVTTSIVDHRDVLQPRVVKPNFTETSAGGREMTLRMTLTRKDLRADESELYGWQKDFNAAAGLENVPPPSDHLADIPWQGEDRNGNRWIVSKIWSKVRHIPKKC